MKKTTSRRERHTKESLRLFGGVRGREGGRGGKPPTSHEDLLAEAENDTPKSRCDSLVVFVAERAAVVENHQQVTKTCWPKQRTTPQRVVATPWWCSWQRGRPWWKTTNKSRRLVGRSRERHTKESLRLFGGVRGREGGHGGNDTNKSK